MVLASEGNADRFKFLLHVLFFLLLVEKRISAGVTCHLAFLVHANFHRVITVLMVIRRVLCVNSMFDVSNFVAGDGSEGVALDRAVGAFLGAERHVLLVGEHACAVLLDLASILFDQRRVDLGGRLVHVLRVGARRTVDVLRVLNHV